MLSELGHFGGLRIVIQEAWVTRLVSGWRRYVQPPVPPRGVRKGTRRQWKSAHPQGLRWRSWRVEVDDHPVLRADDMLIMTARTKARLDQTLKESGIRTKIDASLSQAPSDE